MMIVADVPGAAVLGQRHIGDSFAFQKGSEALNLGSLVAEYKDFGPFAIKVGTNGILRPNLSDPAFDICIFISTRPTLVFCFHGRGEAVQLG